MVIEALAPFYLWTKALHLLGAFAWMAGLFYLPRLFVYHARTVPGSPESELLKVMERRLLRAIMNPAMIWTWGFGVLLILTPGVVDWRDGWWHGKLLGLVILTAAHMVMARGRRQFEADKRARGHVYWRVVNEVPTVALILVVLLAVARPI